LRQIETKILFVNINIFVFIDFVFMIEASDLKAGKTFLLDGKPYKVIKYAHQKIARGSGTVKLSVRNLNTGSLEEKTLNSSTKLKEISTLKRRLQYLYKDQDNAVFMDNISYEQINIPTEILKDQIEFIVEGTDIDVLFWEDRPLSVDLPPKVNLKVKEASPGIKGNSATNMYKPAVLENGLKIKVPLFINKGDIVRIDTKTGEYVERVKG